MSDADRRSQLVLAAEEARIAAQTTIIELLHHDCALIFAAYPEIIRIDVTRSPGLTGGAGRFSVTTSRDSTDAPAPDWRTVYASKIQAVGELTSKHNATHVLTILGLRSVIVMRDGMIFR